MVKASQYNIFEYILKPSGFPLGFIFMVSSKILLPEEAEVVEEEVVVGEPAPLVPLALQG